MVVKSKENLVGAWAFLIGVILAVIIGVLQGIIGIEASSALLALLVILGLIVGLLNVGGKDMNTFLLGAVALVIVSFAGLSSITNAELLGIGIGKIIYFVVNDLIVLFVPATIIVAIKTFFAVAKA